MYTTLKLYKETASGVGVKPMPFPDSGDKQACLSDYKYSATRMSSAPNITATLKWPRCLDDEWSTSVFVSYNGERFFVKNTPSSSYDNTSCLYSHSLELVSERAVLDSVYFLNVPTTTSGEGDNSQGDSLSDSTEFAFSGDIHEFVNRLNKSLIKTGVGGFNGYSAVVDNGATSDTKLFSISNQYVTDVLKSAYELYNIPYYFVGKVIHFGNQQNIINTPPLEYGANNSLLSISKSNSNKQVVTRITGTGSNRNIPYYYPNPTPKGIIRLNNKTSADIKVVDETKFSNNMALDVDYIFRRFVVSEGAPITPSHIGYGTNSPTYPRWEEYTVGTSSEILGVDTSYYDHAMYVQYVLYFHIAGRYELSIDDVRYEILDDAPGLEGAEFSFSTAAFVANSPGIDSPDKAMVRHVGIDNASKIISIVAEKSGYYALPISVSVKATGHPTASVGFKIFAPTITSIAKDEFVLINTSTQDQSNLDKMGLSIVSGIPNDGETISQILERRIDVKNNLMPSVYRRTHGDNMWYNATNSANRDEWYGDVQFDNEYDSRHPVEYIHTDEEIYPTIKGMTNKNEENIDTFIDIAFDGDDNNEIYPEDYEDEKLAGKYKHPYFFVKLKKTDGPNGFNLFDHAIEGETMKISFTTGHVAGCEFEIGVDEDTQKNPVQVDANGDLVRDDDNNVITRGSYIESQQDTQNNEVWIALKKEDSTMGVMMPDTASRLVPLGDLLPTGDKREGGGDKFVILGIHLPEAYITAAEDRLEQELIKYLKENNRERFSFSLKLSSIYLAENPEFANNLNENSRVTLIYNGVPYTMYVTSYSVTVKESSALPEVTISINDELKVVRPKVKDVSAIISSTETKIKEVKNDAIIIKTQALSANASAKDNAEKIRQLQEILTNVDLSSLASQVLENTANINILDRRVTVAILDDYNQPEQVSFMSRLRPNEESTQEGDDSATITRIDGDDEIVTYVVNYDLDNAFYGERGDDALIIEDVIIVEEIINGE